MYVCIYICVHVNLTIKICLMSCQTEYGTFNSQPDNIAFQAFKKIEKNFFLFGFAIKSC